MVFQVSSFQCATVNLGRLQYKLYSVFTDSSLGNISRCLGYRLTMRSYIFLLLLHNTLSSAGSGLGWHTLGEAQNHFITA
jgi:hypothetical protein